MAKRHWLTIALVLSLAVNLLVVGAVVGRLSKGGPERPPPMMWAIKDLDSDIRAELRPVLIRRMSEGRKLRREMAQAGEVLRDLIGQEPFDPEAMSAALADMREVMNRYQAFTHDTAVTVLSELNVEQRQRAARRLFGRPEVGRPPGMPGRPEGPGGMRSGNMGPGGMRPGDRPMRPGEGPGRPPREGPPGDAQ